ncbi:alpha-amylase family glycosyl hydrolase [Pseudomonadota bacterium]
MKIDTEKLVALDSWLEPYRDGLKRQSFHFLSRLKKIQRSDKSLLKFSVGYKYFGFNSGKYRGKAGVWYREWAPKALSLSLIGDFNRWNRLTHLMKKDKYGVWSLFIPNKDGLRDGQKIKVHVVGRDEAMDKIPAYVTDVEKDGFGSFVGVYRKTRRYKWKHEIPSKPEKLRIYEAHVGMSQESGKVSSFDEFRINTLPRIVKQGYNCVQLMGIAQHPYYGSFGYQVSNFYAVSHYFGKEDDFRKLVDEAHGMGLVVLIDLVHSHAVKNVGDGLNRFDGSGDHYFHAGPRGLHPKWDTRLFDYSKVEVLKFLLSNVRFWMEEFKVDGFRFDGVTSMLYLDHGLDRKFDHYDGYFNEFSVDDDALAYLKLANVLAHKLNPGAITIAEDVSGIPGISRPVEEGGLGFDYRLAMGIPDYWIRLLKHVSDDDWNMSEMFRILTDRRFGEEHVGYAESHDQAMVGDKSIAFRLMDASMYEKMSVLTESEIVARGVALHKLIRFVTFMLAGDAWLNFMGNEFGHPEWIDFPREGNNYSHHYARRQWSLVDNKMLRYRQLNEYDKTMNNLDEKLGLLLDKSIELVFADESRKLLVFSRGRTVGVVNFHPTKSWEGVSVGVNENSDYKVVFSTDEMNLGGFDRVKAKDKYPVRKEESSGKQLRVLAYAPSRTAQLLMPVKKI